MSTTWNTQIDDEGAFRRKPTTFRNQVTADGSSGFAPAVGRYHLYVSYACPWAHRALLTRLLKGLDHAVTVDVVDPLLTSRGWTLQGEEPGTTGDTVNGKATLREVYRLADPGFDGTVTVPALWDRERATLVNNESSEIVRMFGRAFDEVARNPTLDLYPAPLREEIDTINARVYETLNNGVYKAGFARTQAAYDRAVEPLFETLDGLEDLLSKRRYLAGNHFTEADIRLFPTLIRFDPVYHTHFKCTRRRIVDYPNLWAYTREIYQVPGVADTVDFWHIRYHYYASHERLNPQRIVPVAPRLDLHEPHGREALGGTALTLP